MTKVIYACREGSSGWTPCAGGGDAGGDGDGYCAQGHVGPLCEVRRRCTAPQLVDCPYFRSGVALSSKRTSALDGAP
eukprot:4042172-Pleurochrysis_carterae.AAC.1